MAGVFTHMLGRQGAAAPPTSSTWALVEARDCSLSPAANQDFINLGGYDELIVILNGVTCSGASSNRRIGFSVDNGASFYNGAGDYKAVANTGAVTNAGEILFSATNGTAAQYHFLYVPSTTGQQKMGLGSQGSGSTKRIFTASASRVNAVRVHTNSADTLNGGTIYVYGRTNAWTLAGSNTSPGASNIDFTGLSGYDELLLVMDAVTASSAANRRVRYSVDNGSSFYAGASDYQREHTTAGANTNWSEAQLCSADATAALTFHHHLLNTTGGLKAGFSLGGREDDLSNDPGHYFKASASRIDALRLTTGTAATLNGGGIYLYGRAKPWTLVEARNCASSPAVNQVFTGLSGYEEALIVMDGVGASGSASRNLQFSTDNGSTYHTTSGDYFASLTNGGGKTNRDTAFTLSAQSSAARYGVIHVPMLTGAVKPVINTGNGAYSMFVASASRIDAMRLASDTAFTLNSGTIYLFCR